MGRRVNIGISRTRRGEPCPVSRASAVDGLRKLNTMYFDHITPWHIQAAVEPAIVYLTWKRDKPRSEYRNTHCYVPDEWTFENHYEQIRDRVFSCVPSGWSVAGWCFADEGGDDA